MRKRVLEQLVEEKQIRRIKVDDMKENFYMRTEDLEKLLSIETVKTDGAVRFIAPLDNLIWDRILIEKVFDFKYIWEVYKPAEQREYGYYVLPVLYQNEFIARFEPQHYKAGEELIIKHWWWEKEVEVTSEMISAVIAAFITFAKYLQAEVNVDKIEKILTKKHLKEME